MAARDLSDAAFRTRLEDLGFRPSGDWYFQHPEFPNVMFGGFVRADGRLHRRETLRVLCAGLVERRRKAIGREVTHGA